MTRRSVPLPIDEPTIDVGARGTGRVVLCDGRPGRGPGTSMRRRSRRALEVPRRAPRALASGSALVPMVRYLDLALDSLEGGQSVTRSDPVVQVLWRNPTKTGGTVRAMVLADDRFGGGLSFELTFAGTELVKYSVERIDPGPLATRQRSVRFHSTTSDAHASPTYRPRSRVRAAEIRADLRDLIRRWGDTTTPREVKLARLAAGYVALLSRSAAHEGACGRDPVQPGLHRPNAQRSSGSAPFYAATRTRDTRRRADPSARSDSQEGAGLNGKRQEATRRQVAPPDTAIPTTRARAALRYAASGRGVAGPARSEATLCRRATVDPEAGKVTFKSCAGAVARRADASAGDGRAARHEPSPARLPVHRGHRDRVDTPVGVAVMGQVAERGTGTLDRDSPVALGIVHLSGRDRGWRDPNVAVPWREDSQEAPRAGCPTRDRDGPSPDRGDAGSLSRRRWCSRRLPACGRGKCSA